MNVTEMLSKLAEAGVKGSRSIAKKGGEIARGVPPASEILDQIKAKVKIDHNAAMDLWASGRRDARVLATMIADARKITVRHIDDWRKDLTDRVVASSLGELAARGTLPLADIARWCDDPDEWTSVIGWSAVVNRAADPRVSDEFLRGRLNQIRLRAGAGEDSVSAVMADALSVIGQRPSLLPDAIATADAIIDRWEKEAAVRKRPRAAKKIATKARKVGPEPKAKPAVKKRGKVVAKKPRVTASTTSRRGVTTRKKTGGRKKA